MPSLTVVWSAVDTIAVMGAGSRSRWLSAGVFVVLAAGYLTLAARAPESRSDSTEGTSSTLPAEPALPLDEEGYEQAVVGRILDGVCTWGSECDAVTIPDEAAFWALYYGNLPRFPETAEAPSQWLRSRIRDCAFVRKQVASFRSGEIDSYGWTLTWPTEAALLERLCSTVADDGYEVCVDTTAEIVGLDRQFAQRSCRQDLTGLQVFDGEIPNRHDLRRGLCENCGSAYQVGHVALQPDFDLYSASSPRLDELLALPNFGLTDVGKA